MTDKRHHPESQGKFTLDECARMLALLEQGTKLPDCPADDQTAWLLERLCAIPADAPEQRYLAQRLVIRLERLAWRRGKVVPTGPHRSGETNP